jgi:hypothetical protein
MFLLFEIDDELCIIPDNFAEFHFFGYPESFLASIQFWIVIVTSTGLGLAMKKLKDGEFETYDNESGEKKG